jgi:branched-chain amino acid aminotransferase
VIAWCDGRWTEGGEAAVGVLDRGLTLGDGLFETILWDGGALRRFGRHMARLRSSAAALSLPPPPDDDALEGIVRETLKRNSLDAMRCAVRITFTAGAGPRGLPRPAPLSPTLIVTAAPSRKAASPVILATSTIARNEAAPSSRFKTLSCIDRVVAQIEAANAGADEALQFNTNGALAGGASSNVFVLAGDEILTPALTDGALPGTVRAALVEQDLKIRTGSVSRDDLARAEAIAITNALQGCRIAARLDGRALSPDHPLLRALRAAALDAT